MDHKFIISIPARLESSRLPNKVLEDIEGKPMLLRVLEQCSKKIDKSKIVLCTDNDKIISLVQKSGIMILLKHLKIALQVVKGLPLL